MTMAVTEAVARGQQAVLCASTGNTSASAAAYAARAGITCAVLVPQGKIAMGKLAQAVMHGAKIIQIDGNFDDCLELARKLTADFPTVSLVNSVNPFRIEGQKTAAFEIVDALGAAPDVHALPVGNAGNITAYWKGYTEYHRDGLSDRLPRMLGTQAAGAAPLVLGEPVSDPETIATAIRIGSPASWTSAVEAQQQSKGRFLAATDEEILAAYHLVARTEGVFVEPASAASIAGPAQVDRGRLGGQGLDRGVHRDRQRPQGPRHRAQGHAGRHPGAGRSRRRGRQARGLVYARADFGDTDSAGRADGHRRRRGLQRQPRARLRQPWTRAESLRRDRRGDNRIRAHGRGRGRRRRAGSAGFARTWWCGPSSTGCRRPVSGVGV